MKKHLLALAALATVSGVAAAQSVSMYGIIDQSVVRDNNTNATAQSRTSMESGAWLPSLIGFTGTEDLGGGLKANFKLEGNLNTDTGALAGLQLFDRQSWVGLSGGFGEFRAGKQIDALFLQSFLNNVRLAHSNSAAVIGGLMAGSYNGGATTDAGATWGGTVFSANTLSYTTPTYQGLKLTVQHQLGEQAGNSSKNQATAYLVNFNGINGLALSAGSKETKGSTGVKLMDQYLVGAVYTLGAVQLNAQINEYKFKSGTYNGMKLKLNELGAAYNITPALTAAVNYVDINIDGYGADKNTDVKSVSLKYALSKRTSLWTMASRTAAMSGYAANGQQVLAAPFYLSNGVGAGTGLATSSRTGYGVGVTHSF
jgi:predicted porin